MRITFILPVVNLSGGIRVISIYAKALSDRGHEVTLISPPPPYPSVKTVFKSLLVNGRLPRYQRFTESHLDNLGLRHIVLEKFRPVEDFDVPDGDIVIATFWLTAEWVENLSQAKGKKVYFVQGHETHEGFPIERVKRTLRNDFTKIVVSEWLRGILEEEYQQKNVILIPNGIDTNLFSSAPRTKPKSCTIGFIFSEMPVKNCAYAIRILNSAVNKHSLNVVAFGAEPPVNLKLPSNIRFHLRPNQSEIVKIYRQCTAWLSTSRSEGFGLPLLEAMACRTPVLGTPTGAAPELLSNGGGELIPPDNIEEATNALVRFCRMDEETWSKHSTEAYNKAKQYDWGKSIQLFEDTLLSLCNSR